MDNVQRGVILTIHRCHKLLDLINERIWKTYSEQHVSSLVIEQLDMILDFYLCSCGDTEVGTATFSYLHSIYCIYNWYNIFIIYSFSCSFLLEHRAPSRMRTPKPSNQPAADLHLRPRGHRNRRCNIIHLLKKPSSISVASVLPQFWSWIAERRSTFPRVAVFQQAERLLVSRYCNFALPISFHNRHSLRQCVQPFVTRAPICIMQQTWRAASKI
jgi:hypothetical protein